MNSTEQIESSDQFPEPPARPHWVRRGLQKCVALAATLVFLQFALTLVARLGATIELASHFCFHALVASLIVGFAALVLRMRKSLWISLFVFLGQAAIVQPWQLLPSVDESYAETFDRSIKVLSWNVLSSNYQFDEVDQVLRKADADLLVLIEVRPGFLDELEAIEELGYNVEISRPSWRGGGVAVFARDEAIELEARDFGYDTYPVIVAKIPRANPPSSDSSRFEESPLYLIAQHTFSPMPISRTPHRDNQLLESSRFAIDHADAPVVLVGDLNVTPWAPVFGELLRAGFRDSRLGTGNCPSWPSSAGPLGIPIDHVLCRGDCHISDRKVLPTAPGSDHRPISFTLRY